MLVAPLVLSPSLVDAQARSKVVVDLSGVVVSNVPFDVPLLVEVTKPPADIVHVELYRLNGRPGQGATRCAISGVWDRQGSWQRSATSGADARIAADELAPNRNYQLCFVLGRKLPDAILTAIRALLARTLDSLTIRDTSRVTINDDIKRVATSLRDLVGAKAVTTGTILDPDTATRLRHLVQLQQLRTLTGNQLRAYDALRNVSSSQVILALGDSRVESDVLALRSGTAATPARGNQERLTAALSWLEKFISSAGAQPSIADIATGAAALLPSGAVARGGTTLSPSELWDVASLSNRARQIARSREAIDQAIQHVRLLQLSYPQSVGPATELAVRLREAQEGLGDVADDLQRMIVNAAHRSQLIASAVAVTAGMVAEEVLIEASTSGTFEARATKYTSIDLGVLAAPGAELVRPYAGFNVYFRPVNKERPVKGLDLGRRIALTAGLTFGSVAQSGRREDLFGSQAAILGAGARITDAIRLAGGILVFRQVRVAPGDGGFELARTPYVSAAIDWDVRNALGVLLEMIPGFPKT